MDAIITAATVMAMYFNSLGSENSRYLYNADIQDGKVASINVYDNSENISLRNFSTASFTTQTTVWCRRKPWSGTPRHAGGSRHTD